MTTAKVKVLNGKGEWLVCRILLDSCSTANLISEEFAKSLSLPLRKCCIPIDMLTASSEPTKYLIDVKFKSMYNEYTKNLSFLTVSRIGQLVPSEVIPREILQIPQNLNLADPDFHKPAPIQMLLGSGPTLSLFSVGQIRLLNNNCELYLQKTRLGWIIGGSLGYFQKSKPISCHLTDLENLMTKFWEVEEINPPPGSTLSSECLIEKHFMENTTRTENGRFVVALPFKDNKDELGESRTGALIQLQTLNRRFRNNPQFRDQYTAAMQQYLDNGHMSIVQVENNQEGYYMPHHAVIKTSSTTTKTRIVFNCSALSSTGVSLNQVLHKGPVIQNSTFIIHLRFRMHEIVIIGDIEKMYLQVLVRIKDQIFQRALWIQNGKVVTLQSNTLTFGETSAPYLATRCLKQLAIDHKIEYPLGAAAIEQDMYVDNLATGANSVEQVIQIRDQVSKILSGGKFHIRQWASNNPKVLVGLNSEEINSELNLNADNTVNMLGVKWTAKFDRYVYTVGEMDNPKRVTKRIILSVIASIYDPLGLLGPIIMYAKIILQMLWLARLDWDESVPSHIFSSWMRFRNELSLINNFYFERFVAIPNYDEICLIGFADASESGYGAVLYIYSKSQNNIKCKLLCAKSRVAPVKKLTLPRLELNAATLLAKLLQEIRDQLGFKFNNIYLWTDSTIVLHWISNFPRNLKTFVANRVATIQSITTNCQWRHVSSKDNPADCLSRGQLPSKFIKNSLWKNGPDWLRVDPSHWPNPTLEPIDLLPETKTCITLMTLAVPDSIIENFSSRYKLLRVLSLLFRISARCQKQIKYTGEIMCDEIRETEMKVIKLLQSIVFVKEIKIIKKNKELQNRDRDFQFKTRLDQLNPFLDRDGILRVGGRLRNSNLSFDRRHPVLLPSYNHYTDLVIKEYHCLNYHCGIQTTLNMIRNRFWLLDGRNQVRKIIKRCIVCFRANPPLKECKMGNFPMVRVYPSRPFSNVGVDFCGPFYVKETRFRNRASIKVYVAVFICMVVKAVHFEVVYDLSTEAFIAALSNFVSRRGYPNAIYSDNATNFKGANNELREIFVLFQSEVHKTAVTYFCNQRKIKWVFIPPHAPNFGGLWESAVKIFKHHLKRVAKNVLLNKDQFCSLVIGIEAIVNSRPITPISNDPNDLQALTPGHFLIGDSLTNLPEIDLTEKPTNRLSVWQHVIKLKQDFWQRWNKEYINELNIRRKWKNGNKNLKIGALVLLKEQNVPTMQWPMGRIIQIHPGSDGVVRTVTVKTVKGQFSRSVRQLAPLPIEADSTVEKIPPQGGEDVLYKCIFYRHFD